MKKVLMMLVLMMGVAAQAHDGGVAHMHDEAVGDGAMPAYDTASPVQIAMYTDEMGVVYKVEADPTAVFMTPKWSGKGEPPLSIGAATEKVIAWIKETYPEFTVVIPETITMQRIFNHGLDDRWVYTVSVRVVGKLGPVDVKYQYQVAVLLDGTVVMPKKEGE